MNKIDKTFSALTIIEIIASIVYTFYLCSTENLGLGALVIVFLCFLMVTYYSIYLIVLTIQARKNPPNLNVGWLIFFNILPIPILLLAFML